MSDETRSNQTQRLSCPLGCPDIASRKLDAPAPWVLRSCSSHGFVWLTNPPDTELLRDDIAWERTSAVEALRRRKEEPIIHTVSQPIKDFRAKVMRRRKLRDLAVRHIRASRRERLVVLDIGCGRGNLLLELMKRLRQPERVIPVGIEISSELAAMSRRKLEPYGGEIIPLDALAALESLDDESIDVITMASYLEHETRPLEVLRLSARKLRPDGMIAIKVPNYDSWNRRMRGSRWCGYRYPDHVNYFGPRSLAAIATAAGLRIGRMNMLDRFPLSDSLYAVLERQT